MPRSPNYRRWTPEDLSLLARFPTTNTVELAKLIGRSPGQVYQKAYSLGLKKSPEYLSDCTKSGRTDGQRGASTRFKPGHKTWNAGRKGWQAGGRSTETQFKRGRRADEAYNYVPIGTLKISHEGYLVRKMTDEPGIVGARRWIGVHRLVWESAHGPVPRGHAVAFLPGRFSTDVDRITLDALELVSRQELMRRNTRHNLPPEVNQLIQLRGALNRKIRNRSKAHEEQDAARS